LLKLVEACLIKSNPSKKSIKKGKAKWRRKKKKEKNYNIGLSGLNLLLIL
jgi:hypothetical protein